MASEYTPNRRYPLYTDSDKPNLRDQYNGAIREIDTDMAQALQDSSAVSSALGAGFDAQHTVRMALDAKADSSALTTETTARESADTALGTRITNETSARESADTALGTRITNETSTRESADTALGTRITSETSARESADNTISSVANNAINHGKVVILIGDSYGEGYTPDGNVTGWASIVATALSNVGITAKHTSVGGARIGNGTFLNALQSVVNSMTNDEKARCSEVVISGGYNDRNSSGTEIYNGCSAIATYIKNNLPHARCILAFIGRCVTGLTTGVHADVSMNAVVSAANNWYTSGTAFGLFVDLHGLNCLKENSFFSSDYVHPNANGQNRIARYITNIISGIYTQNRMNNAEQSGIFTGVNGWSVYGTNPNVLIGVNEYGFATSFMFGTVTNDNLELRRTEGIEISFEPGAFQVGTMHIASMCGTNVVVPASFTIHTTDGIYKQIQGFVSVNDSGMVRVSAPSISDDGNSYLTLTIDRIVIHTNQLAFQ